MSKNTKKLKVSINSPQAVIWEGYADSVSSENNVGVFDILPEHSNFITMIEKNLIIIRNEKEQTKFKFERSLLLTKNDEVFIYTQF